MAKSGRDRSPERLVAILADAIGRRDAIAAYAIRPSEYETLNPVEIIDIRLVDGEAITVFVKHLAVGLDPHPDKPAAEFEARLYRGILSDERLPVVRLLGSADLGVTGGTSLYLEYVDGWNLKHHDLEVWYHAAYELGRLHRHVLDRLHDDHLEVDFLPEFGAAWHTGWAERALQVLRSESRPLATRLEAIIAGYAPVIELLASQPRTLVHNDLAPKNVIADTSSCPPRICFIDWEMAGAGCGLLDLVQLSYGLEPAAAVRMMRSYASAVAGSPLLPATSDEASRLAAACQLQRTMTRIWRNQVWRLPLTVVAGWVDEAGVAYATVVD